jgi:uncharacterized membrane protein YbhN (UPF0104 family)
MKKNKSRRKTWFIVLLIALVIILLLTLVDVGAVLDALRLADLGLLAIGALILLAGFLLISVRGRYLLGNQPELLTTFNTDSISYMIRMVTPLFVPVLRVATLSMATPLTESDITPGMMAERLLELVMRFIFLVLAAILIAVSDVSSAWVILWVALLFGLVALVIRFGSHADEYLPRLSHWLGQFQRIDEERIRDPLTRLGIGLKMVGSTRRMILSLLISLLMWGLFWVYYAVMFASLDFGLNTEEMLALAAAIMVVLPPSTPAMIGVFQGILVALLVPFRVADTPTVTAYAILVFLVMMVLWTILGIWGLRRTRINIREIVKFDKTMTPDDTEVELSIES